MQDKKKAEMTMSKYKMIRKKAPPCNDDDVLRVAAKSNVTRCISRVIAWFNKEKEKMIHITCTGNAISKGITIAEIAKHRIFGLHQVNKITTLKTIDEYQPLEEGLDTVNIERFLCQMCITLSVDKPENTDLIGYQPPLSKKEYDFM